MRSMGRMGWGYRKYLEGFGSFLVILDLRLMTNPKLDFGMTCVVWGLGP
jgi:hypothetical protein